MIGTTAPRPADEDDAYAPRPPVRRRTWPLAALLLVPMIASLAGATAGVLFYQQSHFISEEDLTSAGPRVLALAVLATAILTITVRIVAITIGPRVGPRREG